MNYLDYQTEQNIINPSPFHLDENWHIQIENQNKNCTHNEIDTLAMKGILNYTDFEILKLLATYRYVNTHNIEFALRQILPECYLKTDYRRNLRKMLHAGLLLKYRLCLFAENSVCRDPVSPLCFYSLSPGAYSYIAPLVESPYSISSALPDYTIVEQLASAQLLIRLLFSYKDSVRICYQNIRKKIGNHSFMIDALVRFFTYTTDQPHSVTLFLLCGRSHNESKRNLLVRIGFIFRWLEKHCKEYDQYMILILLESFKDIPLISHHISACRKGGVAFPLYYALDTDILASPLFDSLYQCSEDETTGKSTIDQIRVVL